MAEPTTFVIDDYRFTVAPCEDVTEQLKLTALIGPYIGVFVTLAQGRDEKPSTIVGTLETLPEIFKLLAKRTTVQPPTAQVAIPLTTYLKETFGGNMARTLQFVFHGVRGELGSFLHINGLSLESLLRAKLSGFLQGQTGGSGASSSIGVPG